MFPKLDDTFKQAFIEWEQQTAESWTALLRNPDFLKMVWDSMETTLANQRTLRQWSQQNLAAWQSPAPERQAHIHQQIDQIQQMVQVLTDQVDKLQAQVKMSIEK